MTTWPLVRLTAEPDDYELRIAHTEIEPGDAPDYVVWAGRSIRRHALARFLEGQTVLNEPELKLFHPELMAALEKDDLISREKPFVEVLEDCGYDPKTMVFSVMRPNRPVDEPAGVDALSDMAEEAIGILDTAHETKGVHVFTEDEVARLLSLLTEIRSGLAGMPAGG